VYLLLLLFLFPCTTTFSDPTATDDGGIIYTAVAEAEVQAWDYADDDNDNNNDKKE